MNEDGPFACAACKEMIVMLLTQNNKLIPVNADTIEPGDIFYDRGKHVTHWGTCTNPDRFRKPRP